MRRLDEGVSSVPPDALGAKLVDGRDADPVLLGKIAEAIAPAINHLAGEHWAAFLEAERRYLNNEIRGLEEERGRLRTRIEEQEREYAAVETELHRLTAKEARTSEDGQSRFA